MAKDKWTYSKWTYIGAWDWLQMFWHVIARFWEAKFVEFGNTDMPRGFNDKFVRCPDAVQKSFFSVDQTGTAEDEFNMACVTCVDHHHEHGLLIVADAKTDNCKIEWFNIG